MWKGEKEGKVPRCSVWFSAISYPCPPQVVSVDIYHTENKRKASHINCFYHTENERKYLTLTACIIYYRKPLTHIW